jgi:hypothetical protein
LWDDFMCVPFASKFIGRPANPVVRTRRLLGCSIAALEAKRFSVHPGYICLARELGLLHLPTRSMSLEASCPRVVQTI